MPVNSNAPLDPPPAIDIGAEIALVRRDNPRLAAALDAIVDHANRQAQWVQQALARPVFDLQVLGPDGAADGRIGNWDQYRGAWFRNLLVGPNEANPLISATNGTVAVQGSVVVDLPASSLNVDFPVLSGLTLQDNTPGAGRITWSNFSLRYRGVTHSVGTGSTANSSQTHVYWDISAPTSLTAVAGSSFVPANNRFLLFVSDNGTAYSAYQGPTKNSMLGAYIPDGAIVPSLLDVDFPILSGLTLQDNTPGAGRIAWSGFSLRYRGVTYAVGTGSTASASQTHVYWDLAAPTALTAVAGGSFVPANNRFVLFVNDNGTAYSAYHGPTKNSTLGVFIPDGAIVAAKIAAASIDATKFNTRQIIAVLTFSNNNPVAGSISWTSGNIYHDGNSYAITSGNTSLKFSYWVVGNGSLTATNTEADTVGADRFLIATNRNNAGTFDLAWNKIAQSGIVRNNLAFGLLEGYAPQALASATINPNSSPYDITTTILNESAEGGIILVSLYVLGVPVVPADLATIELKIQIDGATDRTYELVDTEHKFTTAARALSVEGSGDGSTVGSYVTLQYGFTYRSSVNIRLRVSTALPEGSYRCSVFYVHKV